MKAFHLFFLLVTCIGCINTSHQQAVLFEQKQKNVSIHSIQFDSLVIEINKLPNKERILCYLAIANRDEVRIDGILKQEKLLNEILPITSDELRKEILLKLIVIYNKQMRNGVSDVSQKTLSSIENLEKCYKLTSEESWQVRKHKALVLNKLGKQEEYLPIWYQLLKEHREANQANYIIKDLLVIATYFNKLGDNEQAISLYKEAYQLAADNSILEEQTKCLKSLIMLLTETENYIEALNYYHKLEISSTSLSNAIIGNAVKCYIHSNKSDSARFYLTNKLALQAYSPMLYNCQMAETYTIEENADSASFYLNLAVQSFHKESKGEVNFILPTCFLSAYTSYALLLQKKGKMLEAERAFQFVEALMKEEVYVSFELKEQITALTSFSNFYRKTKQYGEALELLAHRDSIQQIYYENKEKSDKKNLVERFRIQELQYTNEMQSAQNKFIQQQLIIVTTSSILLLGALVTLCWQIYKVKKKNKTIKEQNEVIQQYETPSGKKLSDKNLYLLAIKMVTSQKLFLDKEMSIVTLSSIIKTKYKKCNRTYLSNSINDYGEANFTTWINKFRVTYAIKLMHTNANNVNLKKLADQCGFKNNITFVRNFKEIHKVSPGEYLRKIVMEQHKITEERTE